MGESLGLSVWTQDEAGPFQTIPYAGHTWRPAGEPKRQAHEYVRNGTAKLLSLFHPSTGQVRVKGVTRCPNAVLHPWLKQELSAIVDELPAPPENLDPDINRTLWERWCAALDHPPSLPDDLPSLRMLLICDNLKGHKTPSLVNWLTQHGIMPLYTPLGGSWLNMTESIQRILKRRALAGQHPTKPDEIIAWLEAVAAAWNRNPTPFEWGGKRAVRRARSRQRRHALGASGAYTRRPVQRPRHTIIEKWKCTCQVTH
ncbi:MAG: transposase [Anaerolineae bacterium]|nr:transposase [Anaerolineae bacterium]